ncbi:MAG: nucleoside monophosphate kinase [Patescibacteria group bacterium]
MTPSKNPISLIIYGRAGSGKGTQANLLVKKFGLEHFSSGEELRQRQKAGDFTGKKLAKVMGEGKWVPECAIIKIWMDKLEEFKQKRNFRGWIYDGGPRLTLETELLDKALIWYEWQKNIKVILIDISEKAAFDRLTKRRQSENRLDDKPKAIKERLAQFKKYTIPQINYFKKQGKLIKVNGEQPIENVFKDILKKLNGRN